jgi:hypothetical protein
LIGDVLRVVRGTAIIASLMFASARSRPVGQRLDRERRLLLADLARVGVEDRDEAKPFLIEAAIGHQRAPRLPAPTSSTFHVLSVPRIALTCAMRSSTR